MSRHLHVFVFAITFCLCSGAETADSNKNVETDANADRPPVAVSPSAHASTGTGLKAYIDPKTGKPGPVPAPTRRTEVVTPKSPFGLRNDALMWTETLEDGTIVLHTEGQVQMATFAKFSDDGKPELYCEPVALKPEQAEQRAENNSEEKPK